MSGFSFHATVQGAMHVQHGLECQDASGCASLAEAPAHAFAIADGHGDPSCMRSAHGSKVAVEVALELLRAFALEYQHNVGSLLEGDRQSSLLRNLGQSVVATWQRRVLAHYEANPLLPKQWDSMEEDARAVTRERPSHLYGTTLVAGLHLPHALLLIQQGDGCCVVLDGDGTASCPLPEDDRCLGNMTTSLCDTDAAERIRVMLVDTRAQRICACFVGSDGVDKSLRGRPGLFDFCTEVALDALGSSNATAMQAVVMPSLRVLSEQGSGDDTSLAGYVDVQQVAACAPTLVELHRRYQIKAERSQLAAQLNSMRRMHERYATTAPEDDEDRQDRERFFKAYDALEQRIHALDQTPEEPTVQEGAAQPAPVPVPAPSEVPAAAPAPARVSAPVSRVQKRRKSVLPVMAAILVLLALVAGTALGYFVLGGALRKEADVPQKNEVAQVYEENESEPNPESEDAPAPSVGEEVPAGIYASVQQYCQDFQVELSDEESYWQGLNDPARTYYEQCFGPNNLTLEPVLDTVCVLGNASLVEVRYRCGRVESTRPPSSYEEKKTVVLCLRRTNDNTSVDDATTHTETWVVANNELLGNTLNDALLNESGYRDFLLNDENNNGEDEDQGNEFQDDEGQGDLPNAGQDVFGNQEVVFQETHASGWQTMARTSL